MIEALRRCQRGNPCTWQRTQSLGRNRFPPRLHLPCSILDMRISSSLLFVQNNVLPQKKLSKYRFWFFPSTITPAPNSHFFSRKMADELLKAKVHSSAITRCFLSSTGSTGPQPPRERGKTSLRNVVCHKLQLWPQLGNLGLSWEEDSKRLFSKGVTWQGLGHVKLKMLPKNDGLGTSTTAYPSPLLRSSSHSSADKKTSRTLRRTPF